MSDFNAAAHLITLRGKGGPTEYLPVAARIAWFRAENPDGNIAVDAHTITADIAIFHARVSATNGGTAEGWGSETPRDFADYIEKASTKALGRALLALGYGTLQAGDELDEAGRIVDQPQPARQSRTPQPPAGGPPLTAQEYEAVIVEAWAKQGAGATYAELVGHMREYRARFTPDQYEDSVEEMKKLKRATAPQPAASSAG